MPSPSPKRATSGRTTVRPQQSPAAQKTVETVAAEHGITVDVLKTANPVLRSYRPNQNIPPMTLRNLRFPKGAESTDAEDSAMEGSVTPGGTSMRKANSASFETQSPKGIANPPSGVGWNRAASTSMKGKTSMLSSSGVGSPRGASSPRAAGTGAAPPPRTTLASIAEKHEFTVAEVRSANPSVSHLEDDQPLPAGTKISLPKRTRPKHSTLVNRLATTEEADRAKYEAAYADDVARLTAARRETDHTVHLLADATKARRLLLLADVIHDANFDYVGVDGGATDDPDYAVRDEELDAMVQAMLTNAAAYEDTHWHQPGQGGGSPAAMEEHDDGAAASEARHDAEAASAKPSPSPGDGRPPRAPSSGAVTPAAQPVSPPPSAIPGQGGSLSASPGATPRSQQQQDVAADSGDDGDVHADSLSAVAPAIEASGDATPRSASASHVIDTDASMTSFLDARHPGAAGQRSDTVPGAAGTYLTDKRQQPLNTAAFAASPFAPIMPAVEKMVREAIDAEREALLAGHRETLRALLTRRAKLKRLEHYVDAHFTDLHGATEAVRRREVVCVWREHLVALQEDERSIRSGVDAEEANARFAVAARLQTAMLKSLNEAQSARWEHQLRMAASSTGQQSPMREQGLHSPARTPRTQQFLGVPGRSPGGGGGRVVQDAATPGGEAQYIVIAGDTPSVAPSSDDERTPRHDDLTHLTIRGDETTDVDGGGGSQVDLGSGAELGSLPTMDRDGTTVTTTEGDAEATEEATQHTVVPGATGTGSDAAAAEGQPVIISPDRSFDLDPRHVSESQADDAAGAPTDSLAVAPCRLDSTPTDLGAADQRGADPNHHAQHGDSPDIADTGDELGNEATMDRTEAMTPDASAPQTPTTAKADEGGDYPAATDNGAAIPEQHDDGDGTHGDDMAVVDEEPLPTIAEDPASQAPARPARDPSCVFDHIPAAAAPVTKARASLLTTDDYDCHLEGASCRHVGMAPGSRGRSLLRVPLTRKGGITVLKFGLRHLRETSYHSGSEGSAAAAASRPIVGADTAASTRGSAVKQPAPPVIRDTQQQRGFRPRKAAPKPRCFLQLLAAVDKEGCTVPEGAEGLPPLLFDALTHRGEDFVAPWCVLRTAARVNFPAGIVEEPSSSSPTALHEPHTFTLVVDMDARSLVLHDADGDIVARDSLWSVDGAHAAPSALVLGAGLVGCGSTLTLMDG